MMNSYQRLKEKNESLHSQILGLRGMLLELTENPDSMRSLEIKTSVKISADLERLLRAVEVKIKA